MQITPKEKGYIVMLIILGAVATFYFRGLALAQSTNAEAQAREAVFQRLNPFLHLELEAKAVYVYDLRDQTVLYARHATEILPLASLTKIMTAVVALEHLSKDSLVSIDKESLALEGSIGLKLGDVLDRDSMLTAMLVESSNDVAHALAKKVGTDSRKGSDPIDTFIGLMNQKAAELGLSKTQFYDESGLDISTLKSGGYGSAQDLGSLLAYAYRTYPEIFEVTKQPTVSIVSKNNIWYPLENTNTSIDRIPNLLVSKTGYTKLAGGNLSVIFEMDPGHPVMAVVLGSSMSGRFDDIVRVVESSIRLANLTANKNIL